jgi:hypothetical protein
MKPLLIISFYVLITLYVFVSCKKEPSNEGDKVANKPPVANAGRDTLIMLPLDSIKLDGSFSYDPDGSITKYLWTNISGPSSLMINPQFPECKIKSLVKGIYRFELIVTDNGGLSAKDTVMITVDSGFVTNHPPVANAGADQMITLPTNTISLDGSGSSDPDNNISSYQWTKISGPLPFSINNTNAVRTQVTNFEQGVYEFELKITDAGGLVSKDTIRITVFPVTATEIIFTNQVLINLCYQPDVPGACWINGDSPSYGIIISDTANVLPNSSIDILGVWVKMDTSSVWEQVPVNCWQYPAPYPQSNFTYCLTPDILSVWSWFFSFENLAGRKADVKISF